MKIVKVRFSDEIFAQIAGKAETRLVTPATWISLEVTRLLEEKRVGRPKGTGEYEKELRVFVTDRGQHCPGSRARVERLQNGMDKPHGHCTVCWRDVTGHLFEETGEVMLRDHLNNRDEEGDLI